MAHLLSHAHPYQDEYQSPGHRYVAYPRVIRHELAKQYAKEEKHAESRREKQGGDYQRPAQPMKETFKPVHINTSQKKFNN